MACNYVKVLISYRNTTTNVTGSTSKWSSCIPEPYSFELDRIEDAFFIIYPGGREPLESNWEQFELLGSEIQQLESCSDCVEPPPEPENEPYDCVNSACVKKSVYDTPGLYESLEECEQTCGPGCGGKCLTNQEWQQIQDLAKKLRDKSCNG